MKHIYLNLKRFDVPVEFGGVNRIAEVAHWGEHVVRSTQDKLANYAADKVYSFFLRRIYSTQRLQEVRTAL